MPLYQFDTRQTRSGKPFSPFEMSTVDNPSFDLAQALQISNERSGASHDEDLFLTSPAPDNDAVEFWRARTTTVDATETTFPLDISLTSLYSDPIDDASAFPVYFHLYDDNVDKSIGGLKRAPEYSSYSEDPVSKRGKKNHSSIISTAELAESSKNQKRNKRVHEKRRRRLDDQAEKHGHHPREQETVDVHLKGASTVPTNMTRDDFPVTRGGFTALPGKPNEEGWRFENLKEALDAGYHLVEWDGKSSKPFLTEDGRVFLVLVGMPDDPTYISSCEQAYSAMSKEGSCAEFSDAEKEHKRGPFPAKNVGVTMGLGATYPTNLQCGAHKDMLERLLANEHIKRLAYFADAAFNLWAPKLHKHYREHLFPLFKRLDYLRPIFARSIYTAAAFNFGPNVFTVAHRDCMNLPGGWCAIQSLGTFDHTKGGHIFFPQLKMVVEFPSGALVLIPSATIIHGNIPVQEGNSRASFTQYSAGGLFRYVENGYCTEAQLRRTDKKGYERICALKETRWQTDYERYSLLSDLVMPVEK
ncbi:hypothetical protein H0H93_009451 [Arthromyces matolae]|nr:hypothetical protein H0H93_009451 [Arthromyces matolae]